MPSKTRVFCKTEFAEYDWRVLQTDEAACSTQRVGGHISLLSPVNISPVHTDNNDLLSVGTLSSHNAETANHRPSLPGSSCHYQTRIALNPWFRKDSRHVQHRTLHREMTVTSHRHLSCLAAGENFKGESGFFHHQAPMLARHATDQKQKLKLGLVGHPFS